MMKFIFACLLFLNLSIHATDSMEELALEIGHYINNDWHQDDEKSRRKQMETFLDNIDTHFSDENLTSRRLTRFFETSLCEGWTEEELEQVAYDRMSFGDMLYNIASIAIEGYYYKGPLWGQGYVENSLAAEESIRFNIAAATLAQEKKRQDFRIIFSNNGKDLDKQKKILSESYIRGKESVSDISVGGAFIFILAIYIIS